MFATFIAFVVLLMFFKMIRVKNPFNFAVFTILAFASIFFTVVLGMMLNYVAHPEMFNNQTVFPELAAYSFITDPKTNILDIMTQFVFYIAYDVVHYVFYINIHYGSLYLYIPELIGFWIVANWYNVFFGEVDIERLTRA